MGKLLSIVLFCGLCMGHCFLAVKLIINPSLHIVLFTLMNFLVPMHNIGYNRPDWTDACSFYSHSSKDRAVKTLTACRNQCHIINRLNGMGLASLSLSLAELCTCNL